MSVFADFCQQHGLIATDGLAISKTAGRKDLAALFHAMGYQAGAEIGVWQGRFSEQLCILNPGVRLLCVDPWHAYDDYGDPKNSQERLDDAHRQAVKRLKPYGCDIRKMTSTKASTDVPDGSLDFVYLDGNHAKGYVLSDLKAWAPKVKPGGVISGHDYEIVKRHAHLQVKDAVDEYARLQKIAPIYVLTNDKVPSFFWRVPEAA